MGHKDPKCEDEIIHKEYSCEHLDHFSIAVTDALAELIGIDPTKHQMNLNEYMDLDALDNGFRYHKYNTKCIETKIPLGDYQLQACTCGDVKIRGDLEQHKAGHLNLPTKMYPSTQTTDPNRTNHDYTPDPDTKPTNTTPASMNKNS